MNAQAFGIILGIVALILIAGFFVAWKLERNRAHGVADDQSRLDPKERKRSSEARRRQ